MYNFFIFGRIYERLQAHCPGPLSVTLALCQTAHRLYAFPSDHATFMQSMKQSPMLENS